MTKNYAFTIVLVTLLCNFTSFSQTYTGTVGPIDDNNCATTPNTFSAVVTGATSFYLAHINVDITHPFIGDIALTLTHVNSGTSVVLVNSDGTDGGDNYTNTVFTQGSNTSITLGAAPYSAGFLPENSMAAFIGLDPNSEWLLTVCDGFAADTGTLDSWSITFAEPSLADSLPFSLINVLNTGTQFSDFPIIGNNTGATASENTNPWYIIPTGCGTIDSGGYLGGDLWFDFVASVNGTITIETDAVSGSDVTDTAIAIYDRFDNLIACNDDKNGSDFFSKIEVGGLSPFATYTVRVWEFNNNSFGEFQISAYVNDTYVPDDNFENYLETHDASGAVVPLGDPTSMGNGTVNDDLVPTGKINTVTDLNVSNLGISDLTGIEGFVALTSLVCFTNNLTSLDVSQNTALTYLDCDFNSLNSLDVSQNTALTNLVCSVNNLTSLDVSQNTALTNLICHGNNLSYLDVSQNTSLQDLECHFNNLTYLDVSNGNNSNFVNFRSDGNSSLSCIEVDDPVYSTTNWTNIDPASSFSEDCGTYVPDDNFENYLETHDASGAVVPLADPTSMGNGIANDNYVTTSRINTVTGINVDSQSIADLTGIEDFTALNMLRCRSNNLTNIDISNNSNLTNIDCLGNNISNLDVSHNLSLTRIACGGNNIGELNLENNLNLEVLDIQFANLNTLNVSNNPALWYLDCRNNSISDIDVSQNSNLRDFRCSSNALMSLNIKNNNNSNVVKVWADNNPNLNCIDVDDIIYASANWNAPDFLFDPQSYFSIDCNFNNIPEKAYTLNVGHDFADLAQIADNTNATASELIDPSIPTPTGCGDFDDGGYNGDDLWYAVSIPDDGSVIIETAVESGSIVNDTAMAIYSGSPGSLIQIACNDDIDINASPQELFSRLTITGRTPNETIYVRVWTWNNEDAGTFQISAYRNPAISTYVPDIGFQFYLESHDANGVDVGLGSPSSMGDGNFFNNYVPTAKINTVTNLNVASSGIADLTGIEGFTALENLNCFNNLIDEIDLSQNTNLEFLECSNNLLTNLDVSLNINLLDLLVSSNQLESLNMNNNNNVNMRGLIIHNNPNLTCITVDNQTIADDWNTGINTPPIAFDLDPQNAFSTNCGEVILEPKAYLQGAFLNPRIGEEAFMRDDLRALGHLPSTSPYPDNAPVIGTPFNTIGTDAIVDWVWVELRDDTDNMLVIEGQSALIQRDGDIVGPDGVSPLVFSQPAKHYNVAVKHRNHSAIMSSVRQAFPLNQVQNYKDGVTTVLGSNALSNINGTLALWAGDVNDNGQIKFSGANNDTNSIKDGVLADPANAFNSATFTSSGYLNYDLDLNGNGKFSGSNSDSNILKDIILNHPGNGFNSPTFTIFSFVPEN